MVLFNKNPAFSASLSRFFWKVSLAQMASRMATYMEITPPSPQKRLQATRCLLEKI